MSAWLMLHGFTGSPASFARLSLPMAACLVPALRGHAGGPTGAPGDGFETEVDRLASLLPDVETRLLGYSLGARIGLGLLVRHPARFVHATLVGLHPGLSDARERADRVASDERWCTLLETRGIEAFVAAWEQQPLFASQAASDPQALCEQRRIRRSHDPRALAAALRSLGLGRMPSYWADLSRIDLPVTLVTGEADAKFAALAAEAAARLPHAELRVLPGVGHNPLLECPERLAQLLKRGD